jgi:3-phytase
VKGKRVRSFDAGDRIGGVVADDLLDALYVAVDDDGVFKYRLAPSGGSSRTQIEKTGSRGRLVADTKGLALYQGAGGTGYLLVSSQGDSSFKVYAREARTRMSAPSR